MMLNHVLRALVQLNDAYEIMLVSFLTNLAGQQCSRATQRSLANRFQRYRQLVNV